MKEKEMEEICLVQKLLATLRKESEMLFSLAFQKSMLIL